MQSIKNIFVIGKGPSSSHTMGPAKACEYIKNKYKDDIEVIVVYLYGSLARTGKGHLTDIVINSVLDKIPHTIVFDVKKKVKHPNTMHFRITLKNNKVKNETVLSIGGGSIITIENFNKTKDDIYPHTTMTEILNYCDENKLSLSQYVLKYEDKDILDYLKKCADAMIAAGQRGIKKDGELPGNLHIKRKAKEMYHYMMSDKRFENNYEMFMAIVATAASEENASGGEIVIGPTCGSCGVIPGCIAYLEFKKYNLEQILNGMLVAGLVGNLCKTNGSIAGAEAGCQAEIGVACAMGASLIATANGFNNRKIAQAAEVAIEHSLGLTCDPVEGYVQIPCIERNAVFALKAKNAVTIASLIPTDYGKISFDDSVKTMYQTGLDLHPGYKETSMKGLAKLFKHQK